MRVVLVPAGESFNRTEMAQLERAVRTAEHLSGLTFSVYVGVAEEDSRGYARRLHSALDDPARSVLVMCDPDFHALEIITGVEARRTLDDTECRLAAASMQSSFLGNDIIGGLVQGIHQLGEAAHVPRTLHARR